MGLASSRIARLSASILLSLVMTVGLGSAALGASPTDPPPDPTPAPIVTPVTTPSGVPAARPATDPKTRSKLNGCRPVGWDETIPHPGCATPGSPAAAAQPARTSPSATTGCPPDSCISGTVTGTGGTPLADVWVDVYSYSIGYYSTTTAADGTWLVPVPVGSFTVAFWDAPDPYVTGYYSSSSSGHFSPYWDLSTPVSVGPSSNVPGIDAQLATGRHISGTVTVPGGMPVQGIQVDAASSGTYYYSASTETGADGSYQLLVPAGTYTLFFSDDSGTYLNGYYSSGGIGGFGLLASSATPVTVNLSDVTGKNVQLGTGYHIKGRVTGVDGAPIMGVSVGPYSSSYSGSGTTVSDGTYSVAVPLGTYMVQFWSYGICWQGGCMTPYLDGFYSSGGFVIDQAQATVVSVGSADVAGIDIVMSPSGTTYHALTPTRLLDTRNGTGLAGAFSSHVARTFQVAGVGGVVSYATAVTGNLTVTQQGSPGFLYMGPDTMNNPTSSTLNFPLGDDRANAVTVALSNTGTLSVTYAASTFGPTAQVIFDVTGYFTPYDDGATYHALTPIRLLDTRSGMGLAGAFSSHVARTFQVTGHGGVLDGATAVTGNLTVTQQTSLGFLYMGPTAMDSPTSSTLNFPLGDDRANAVTVALSDTGALSVTYAASTFGPTAQVIFDVTGFFTPDRSGSRYVPLTPKRILDTRNGTGLSGASSSHVARPFQVAGLAGAPSFAGAATGNLTVTGQTSPGFLYIGPYEKSNPVSSNLNFPLGDDRANAVTVALNADGSLAVTYAASTYGPTAHVIFDVTGYFVEQGGIG